MCMAWAHQVSRCNTERPLIVYRKKIVYFDSQVVTAFVLFYYIRSESLHRIVCTRNVARYFGDERLLPCIRCAGSAGRRTLYSSMACHYYANGY